jgi:hypothetical protein
MPDAAGEIGVPDRLFHGGRHFGAERSVKPESKFPV